MPRVTHSGLATVMFTDLVGSTRMRERLGDDVADEIGVEHDRIIGDALASTGGRLVKNLGDGALAVFDSSVDAVLAGQRIQEGVLVYNRQTDGTRQIGVRIGINAGEIATDDGDVIGLPVAVASRVCDKATGGQILITDVVRSLPTDEKVIADALDIFTNHPIHDQIAIDIWLNRDDPDVLAECGDFVEKNLLPVICLPRLEWRI